MTRRKLFLLPFKYREGGVWIGGNVGDPMDQIYSIKENETGKFRHYHIMTLGRIPELHKLEPVDLEIKEETARYLMTNNGIEHKHLLRVTPDRLREPVLLVHCDDGTDIFADGSHRYVCAAMLGRETIPAYLIPERLARGAELKIPDDLAELAVRQ